MLQRLVHHQMTVKSVFIHKFPNITVEQQSSLTKVYLDHDKWDIMQALHDILAPIEFAVRSLSGQYYTTLALAYTTINILRYGLRPKQEDSQHVALFKKSV